MPRYKLTIEYDGGPFVGWQRQQNGISVQQCLEEAVEGFSGQKTLVYGAGRTDAGVHARGQVAHLDLVRPFPSDKVRDAINYHVKPHPIAIVACEEVDEHFHARFHAYQRHYLYRISMRRPPLTLERGQAWQVYVPLNVTAMDDAAQALVGTHDFTTFRAARCQAKSPVKEINAIDVIQYGDEAHITVRAPSFLHNQVRSIVGSLKLVGEGRWSIDDMRDALAVCDRTACGPLAPAEGLYLMQVDYPE